MQVLNNSQAFLLFTKTEKEAGLLGTEGLVDEEIGDHTMVQQSR